MTKSPYSQLLSELDFCVIDLETTGGNLKTDRIIEIGLAHVQNFKTLTSKSYFVNPQKKIPDFIQKLTSITDEDVKDAPTIDKIIDEIREFIGEKIVVAHNISFDIPFLNAVLKKLKKKALKNNILCTNVMTKHLIPGITNSNLPYLCDIFNIKHARAHHAHDDALATAELLITYLKVFSDRDIRKVNQLYYPKNKFEFDKFHQVLQSEVSWDEITKKIDLLSNPFYVSFKSKTGEILFATYFDDAEQFRNELPHIKNMKLAANMVSLKLYGSNLEALLHLKESYAKCSPVTKERIHQFLWQRPQLKEIRNKLNVLIEPWGNDYNHNLNNLLIKDYYLIVTRHLIDGQLMLLHSPYYSYKNSTIFKFSSQKRKFFQHIEQLHKKDFNSLKVNDRTFADHNFSLLWFAHLLNTSQSKDYLVIPYQELALGNEALEQKIHKFIDKTKNKHRYPMHHL